MSRAIKRQPIGASIYSASAPYAPPGRKSEVDSEEARNHLINLFKDTQSTSVEWNAKFTNQAATYTLQPEFLVELVILAIRVRNMSALGSERLRTVRPRATYVVDMRELLQACEETKCKVITAHVLSIFKFTDKNNSSYLHLVTPLIVDALLDIQKVTPEHDGILQHPSFVDRLLRIGSERQLIDYIDAFATQHALILLLVYLALRDHPTWMVIVLREIGRVLKRDVPNRILKIAVGSNMDPHSIFAALTYDDKTNAIELTSLFDGSKDSRVMLVKLMELGINLHDLLTDSSKPNYLLEVKRAEHAHSQLTQCLTSILGSDLTNLVLQYW